MKKIILILIIVLTYALSVKAQTLTIKITEIKSTKGQIRLAFFQSQDDLSNETPSFAKYIGKSKLKNGAITVKYTDIKKGKYGIALLDDEDCDGLMKYAFYVPREGFGFSNYKHKGMKKPKFNDFCFDYDGGDMIIYIEVRYIM
ncbi:MAG: DUF2141 domain-containing protein [Bacteroidales bacterium]|jgi:uncharacterized protein (DUF2141 family)|nr:DUF2141 domain-containing protein [Bacteroidales bacterium]MDD4217503.1 DUF2141 domain-containing protein [Bacteroidales bacterium]MDY0142469.1 DUF2141 domain-containing protein [Bacteroidales bacterium]